MEQGQFRIIQFILLGMAVFNLILAVYSWGVHYDMMLIIMFVLLVALNVALYFTITDLKDKSRQHQKERDRENGI